jgi:hypothetical protein
MTEHRRAIRRRVLKSAMIELEGGAYSCGVQNLSDCGAALNVRIPSAYRMSLCSSLGRYRGIAELFGARRPGWASPLKAGSCQLFVDDRQ